MGAAGAVVVHVSGDPAPGGERPDLRGDVQREDVGAGARRYEAINRIRGHQVSRWCRFAVPAPDEGEQLAANDGLVRGEHGRCPPSGRPVSPQPFDGIQLPLPGYVDEVVSAVSL